jgi:hypothetical protein
MISGLGFPRENIIPDMKLSAIIIALTGDIVNTYRFLAHGFCSGYKTVDKSQTNDQIVLIKVSVHYVSLNALQFFSVKNRGSSARLYDNPEPKQKRRAGEFVPAWRF